MLTLDHIAVATTSLETGTAEVEAAIGLPLAPGGRHPAMGTWNRLLSLGPGEYFELIAIEPGAQAPAQPRWFDLDHFAGPPRLTNWICRTCDLAGAVAACPEAGVPVALQRGDLRWRMAVPDSGQLPWDNGFPALMEWQGSDHPARRLARSSCRLHRLVIRHPEAAALRQRLAPFLKDPRIAFEADQAGMCAEIETPGGIRVLR